MGVGRKKCKVCAPTGKKTNLHVRESNPGRLRDRQKCYQLHQHGPASSDSIETLHSLFVDPYRVGIQHKNMSLIIRSYHGGSTASHPNCEVKHLWAQSVLRWGTTRESWVSNVFLTEFFFERRMFFFNMFLGIFFLAVCFSGPNPSFAERTSPQH